jgi:penicillin-binding protein 1A
MAPGVRRPAVVIANARRRALWWQVPAVLLLWLPVATAISGAVALLAVLRDYQRDLPRVPDLERWEARVPRTSYLVAADGTVLAELPFRSGREIGHRRPVPLAAMPAVLQAAILAAEDVRFLRHHGVDPASVLRAAWSNYRAGRIVEGASTITQQVARNLLPEEIGRSRTLRRKVREALLAWRIERRYGKQRIFEIYANHVFLGAGAYGVAAAADRYFAKSLDRLSTAEAALIAGLAQAPGRRGPHLDPAAARARRDEVLDRMYRAGFLDAAAHRTARAEPVVLRRRPQRHGLVAPWYTELVRRQLAQFAPAEYARGGLRVQTAALPVLAQEVEQAAAGHLAAPTGIGPAPELALLVWDHRTGYVEALLGGRSWSRSQFDRVTQACRQPGSTFKPVVYAAALDRGELTPATLLPDVPIADYDDTSQTFWKPRGGHHRGAVLLAEALAASLNSPALEVLDRVGIPAVIAMARQLGIRSPLAAVRPLALGASCVVPLELATAFATFAGGGRQVEPVFAVRITVPGAAGEQVLVDRSVPEDPHLPPALRLDRLAARAGVPAEVRLDRRTAFLVSSLLSQVILRGTGRAAQRLGRPVAGKTGTTNGNTDAWFIGYTGRVLASVWLGHDDPRRPLGPEQDGRRAALPLWIRAVAAAESDRPPLPVPGPPPEGVVAARIDPASGLLAPDGGGLELFFRAGTAPVDAAPPRVGAELGRISREF